MTTPAGARPPAPPGTPPTGAPRAHSESRHVVPALVFLLALCLLTALVWWRVVNRDDARRHAASSTCSTSTSPGPQTLPEPSQVTVVVYNSTPRNGLAGKVQKALKQDGFKLPDPATNDPHKKLIPGVAEIRYGSSGASAAQLLSYYFPGATLVSTTATDSTVAVSLGAKYTTMSTPQAVKAALQKAGVVLASASATPTPTSTC